MGRLTHSFRTVYSEVLDDLRKEMQNCFVDVTHKDAFDLLYREVWRPEEVAMGNSRYQRSLINSACLLIELIKAKIKMRETKIQALQEIIESLEQKINDQAHRLDVLCSHYR